MTWGGSMDTAGAALGSALDGIQDFDWQHVRNYVGTVTGARRAAEIGALTAQVGFVTSYTGAVNNYTASIATAAVTHTTLYAQATADYYVDTADQEALAAEAAVTTAIAGGASQSEIDTLTATATAKRAKATAFATFAPSYVTHFTTQAQSAATTAVASVTSANTTALATITTEVATATTDINTFYDTQVTTAANPPPVDTDLNNDGIPDPPTPTATQSITASITAAKTANTTARTAVHTAFNAPTTRQTTTTTNTFTVQPTSVPSGGNTGGIPTAYQSSVVPPATPPGGNSANPATPQLQNQAIDYLFAKYPQLADQDGNSNQAVDAIPEDPALWTAEHAERMRLRNKMTRCTGEWPERRSGGDDGVEKVVMPIIARIIPALQTAAGAIETVVGSAIGLAGGTVTVAAPPAGVVGVPAAVFGAALAVNGADVFWAGLQGLWNPYEEHETYGRQVARENFSSGGEALYDILQIFMGSNTPAIRLMPKGSDKIDDALKNVDELPSPTTADKLVNDTLDDVAKEVGDVPYTLFNKTHVGSQPVPKGVGPNGGRLQSHHGLQQEWAASNLSGYNPKLAPTVTIETGRGFPHTTLSNLQNARRDARVAAGLGKWSSSIDDELSYIVSDFRQAGFGDDVVKQVLEQNYRMLDELGVNYTKPAGF